MGQGEELIKIFLDESRENIDLLDQEIINLETDPENKKLLDEIFRAFHTLKGNAGIVGMKKFEKFAHIAEEVLTDIRDGNREINSDIITFMLDSLDRLKVLHKTIVETGSDEAEVDEQPSPENTTENKKSKSKKNKSKKTKKSSSGKKEAAQEEIVADDGSWGIFLENLEATEVEQQEKSEIVADDNSEGIFTENLESDKKEEAELKKAGSKKKDAKTSGEKKAKPAGDAGGWGKAESTIRVNVSLLDNLMNYVGELVLSRNQILQFAEDVDDTGFDSTCQRFNMVTNDLQEIVMKARLMQVGNVFNRFPRVVRDVTRKNGKKVILKIEGQETELDKTVIDAISDPLTHLVRNAIDHGIETIEARKNAGKDPAGTLILKACHEGGQVIVEISDDGAGIDPDKLRKKVVEKGLMTTEQVEALSDNEAIELAFLPGFSTAKKVTNISGRGVGMDVVKTNITHIGGRVEISSKIQQGTTIKINLPLTMSIIDGLLIRIADERYVMPLSLVLECVELQREECENGRRVANVRGEIIPYIRLRESFSIARESSVLEQLVITQVGGLRVGFTVDEVIGHYQTVIKTLGKVYRDVDGISGSTILGDGTVALILDIPKLVQGTEIQEQYLHQ